MKEKLLHIEEYTYGGEDTQRNVLYTRGKCSQGGILHMERITH